MLMTLQDCSSFKSLSENFDAAAAATLRAQSAIVVAISLDDRGKLVFHRASDSQR
jgi:hypothetical protein